MPRQDKVDRATRALIAEAEERVRTRTQGSGTRMDDEELGRWIDKLQARLVSAMDARKSREVSGVDRGTDRAAG